MLWHNQIYHGDCLELMPQLDDKSIDMILCDLPYGITECKWDTPIDLELLWKEYKRIIKPAGAIILTARMPFGARLIMSNPKWFRHELIWEKDNTGNPFNANIMPLCVHENVLIFCGRSVTYNPQKTAGKPYNMLRLGNNKPILGQTRTPRKASVNNGSRFPRSVIKFKKDYGKSMHPTQKPTLLFEWLIKTYSNEGDLILDNCAGSGTTAIAAINTNRRYILMEKDENYFNVAQNRILQHTPQLLLNLDQESANIAAPSGVVRGT